MIDALWDSASKMAAQPTKMWLNMVKAYISDRTGYTPIPKISNASSEGRKRNRLNTKYTRTDSFGSYF